MYILKINDKKLSNVGFSVISLTISDISVRKVAKNTTFLLSTSWRVVYCRLVSYLVVSTLQTHCSYGQNCIIDVYLILIEHCYEINTDYTFLYCKLLTICFLFIFYNIISEYLCDDVMYNVCIFVCVRFLKFPCIVYICEWISILWFCVIF